MKTVKTVVAAIIEKNGKIFAAMRSEDGFMFNKWEFPGGKLEDGETDQEALKRELREELSIEVFNLVYFDHVEYEYEKFILKMNAYKCKTNDDIHHLNVHKKAGFFDRSQLMKLDFLPADVPLITKLLAEWR
ncbi:MAG TPA: (deoxy)nucleoside triphosphate pyrophosphohydrolase [Bacilli bacterium]|nr:(deoxy)nucleoside triphosphate pyrophosphohydrolase [Bacilli bacterium]